MLDLDKNPDFKDISTSKIANPYYDLNGDKMSKTIDIHGTDALDQAIEMVLCTEPYERLFNLSFSSPLYQILFENYSYVDELLPKIFDTIEYWVPIKIDRNNTDVIKQEWEHSLSFKIPYISNDGRFYHIFSRVIAK